MDESKLWFTVFLSVVTVGIVAISLQLLIPDGTIFPTGVSNVIRDGYRLLSIFLGVLAGTSLGELFKIRNNGRTGRKLLSDLLQELQVNITLVGKGIPLRKGFWILGIRSGRAEFLTESDRLELWDIYSIITHFNDDLQHVHRAKVVEGQKGITPEFQNELDNLNAEIKLKTKSFLTKHGVNITK